MINSEAIVLVIGQVKDPPPVRSQITTLAPLQIKLLHQCSAVLLLTSIQGKSIRKLEKNR